MSSKPSKVKRKPLPAMTASPGFFKSRKFQRKYILGGVKPHKDKQGLYQNLRHLEFRLHNTEQLFAQLGRAAHGFDQILMECKEQAEDPNGGDAEDDGQEEENDNNAEEDGNEDDDNENDSTDREDSPDNDNDAKMLTTDVPVLNTRGICTRCAKDGCYSQCEEVTKISPRFKPWDHGDKCYRCKVKKVACSWANEEYCKESDIPPGIVFQSAFEHIRRLDHTIKQSTRELQSVHEELVELKQMIEDTRCNHDPWPSWQPESRPAKDLGAGEIQLTTGSGNSSTLGKRGRDTVGPHTSEKRAKREP
ncbi:hypothetical protein C8Q80DRAFT_1274777 [Daedaleopsis nitida]|nr:hypothetical protein C8Q80DRAFT_1274777 [Daedaleopsis nitida]